MELKRKIFEFYRVIVLICLLLISSNLLSQTQLNFNQVPTVSGTSGAVGAKYTYSNVGTQSNVTVKAVIEIISTSGGAILETIDQSGSGSANAWQPVINGSQTSGGCWGIEFKISFFDASNNSPVILEEFKASGIDIDGDGGNLREYNTFYYPTSYTVENPTNLIYNNVGGLVEFKSTAAQVNGIALTATRQICTNQYDNKTSITIKLGSCCVGANCRASNGNRLHSINFFDAIVYIAPTVNIGYTITKSQDKNSFSTLGEVVSYNIIVKNTGNQTLTNVLITDPNATITGGLPISTLAAGASATVTATHTVTTTDLTNGSILNTASSTATGPNNTSASGTSNTVAACSNPTIIYSESSFCAIGTTNVSRTGLSGGVYSATPAGLSIDSATGTINLSASTPNTYTISYTVSSPCAVSATTSVTVKSQPVVPTVGTLTQPTCAVAIGSVVLSGLPSGTWTINRTGTSSDSYTGTTSSYTVPELTAGTYAFTVTNSVGCTSLATRNITINPFIGTPAVPKISITQPTCTVSTGIVTITAASGITFSFDGGPYTSNLVYDGLGANTTHTVFAKNGAGCISSVTEAVINAQPVTPVQPTLSSVTQPTCTTATGSFTISNYNAAYTYVFTQSSGVINTAGTITAPAGTYTVTAALGACTSIDSESKRVVSATQDPKPTDLACYQSAAFDTATCKWVTSGTKPAEPTNALACYETRTFDNGLCDWKVTGTKPVEPTTALACYETRTFDNGLCDWKVTGTKLVEPTTALACYETRSFDTANCKWVVSGTQAPKPNNLACYQTATFNTTSCQWDVTGTQSANPTIACNQTGAFITRWDLAGTTTLSFGTATSGSVTYTWQEELPGTASGSGTFSGTTLTITGLPSTKILLSINPTNFQRIKIGNNQPLSHRLLDVKQWGTTAWTSMQDAFFGCKNLNITATDVPNLTSVTRMDQMFQTCSSLTTVPNINSWNTSAVQVMTSLFNGAKLFNQNIGSWNTSSVISMQNMFAKAESFNQNISGWNIAKVTRTSGMFEIATSFNQNISGWNTALVTDMNKMFRYATSFNQNIGNWSLNANVNLSNMLDYSGMDCSSYAATLIGWNANLSTPNNRTLGAIGRNYPNLAARTNLVGPKGWTITGDVLNNNSCGAFITRWDLAGTTTLSFGTATIGTVSYSWQEELPGTASGLGTFSGTTLTITGLPSTTIILSIYPTNFQRIKIGNQPVGSRLLDVKQWGTTVWTSMQDAFFGCKNLNITATDSPVLTSVTRMEQMFQSCSSLTGPTNISSWNVGAVTNMTSMFNGAKLFNQNIGSWNTVKVVSMQNMFAKAESFNQNIGGWNTAALTRTSGMFEMATSFNQNIGNWNTAAVTMMDKMFQNATAFNQNIGNWSLNASVNLSNMLNNSGMDCSNYGATLVGWNANATCPTGRTLGATGRTYGSTATAARTNLVASKGWTITGDGTCATARMNVNTVTDLFNVKAFPNPFASHFSLDIESSSDAPVQVKVYDMIGRQLEANQANVSELSIREIGRNYPSGVYNVVVSQGEKVTSLRMVKK